MARLSDVERARIERLSRRDVAVHRLERLLREGTDQEVLAALAAMKETGADFPQGFDWAMLRAVEERTELSEGIMAALAVTPPDLDRLSTLLPAAKAAAEAGNLPQFPGTTLEQIELDTLRAARVARIREAIAANDDDAIRAVAVPDTDSLLEMLTEGERTGCCRHWHEVRSVSRVFHEEVGPRPRRWGRFGAVRPSVGVSDRRGCIAKSQRGPARTSGGPDAVR